MRRKADGHGWKKRAEAGAKRPARRLASVILGVPALMMGAAPALGGEGRESGFVIADKTLVAWVYLADTTQRGGSVLTLIDDEERFDAIVFGEKTPGKWMAGSDFFRRTEDDQSDYPVETADPKTLVQIAVAYEKNRITIYRDGKRYARYEIDRAQSFTEEATALLGLRYAGGMGEIGAFAGAVEEARIYSVALDAEAIAALKPGEPPDPKPLAQWTFENGAASDSMGTFPDGVLHGGARIADGKLHLDGKDSYMEVFRPRRLAVQTVFYRPRSRETGRMLDTWLYLHEGTYYLYCLASRGARWDNISLATSPDGVHWREHGRALAKREGVTWMGTGSTWRSPNFEKDGRFFMNFSEWRGPRQTIFFAESTDLTHWKRLGDEYEFQQDTRWYEVNGRWDCIYTIPRPGGGLYGYWTATPKPETGGRFGFGESVDGVKWEALEPPKTPGVGEGEAGAVERIGEKCYMMFGTEHMMVTLVADGPEGPFLPAKKNFRLLSGHTYFSRFFPTPDGLLVNHHSIARHGPVYFAPLKSTVVDAEGTLRLGCWKGNEKMKHEAIGVKAPVGGAETGGGDRSIVMLDNTFDVRQGIILEGALALPEKKGAPRRGLYIECEGGQ
ncbi:MAG TPA: LamG-like jellyroll fold domain-containing protein, partial [Sumerlaeia bacterium]|nr:LamG-like jellyroll fold domain-containing protein [Sumerlaeia bacterium]